MENLPLGSISIHVLACRSVTAYSWPNGEIYVTLGLLNAMGDEELAAAIAHEIGHLLDGGHLSQVWSLGGTELPGDLESRADLIGCRLLASKGISTHAMARMLEKLRCGRCSSKHCCEKIARRIEELRSAIGADNL